jgi:glycerol-3-phosphate dehydrogenase
MRRDLEILREGRFDLVVVGAGIHGACAAWDAALRGFKVALVEAGDLGAATSANSLKVLHGGFRYLQSLDLSRLRLSARETATWLRIAPHLAVPLPCLLPLRGGLTENPLAMSVALKAYGLLAPAEARVLAGGRVLSAGELTHWAPAVLTQGAAGAALWHDGLALDSERLTLALVQAAAGRGAAVANYLEALGLETARGAVAGVRVRDLETSAEFLVRGRAVLVAAGAFTNGLCREPARPPELALAYNLVVERRLGQAAVAVRSRTGAEGDPVCGGGRFMFMVPWRGRTLLGTSYRPWDLAPEQARPRLDDLLALLAEFNAACPGLGLRPEEIGFFHWGLLPLARPGQAPAGGGLASQPRIVDHAAAGGPAGLFSLRPVKFTTARALAQQAVDLAARHLGRGETPCGTAREPVWGGEAAPVRRGEALAALEPGARAELALDYGAHAAEVAALMAEDADLALPLAEGCPVLGCQVAFAARREMALHLTDVVLRRTMLGKAGPPPQGALERAAAIMARELGWDEDRRQEELRLGHQAHALVRETRGGEPRPGAQP